MKQKPMASLDVTAADPGQYPAENLLRSFARAMNSTGVMLEELCVAIEDCGDAELYDDPQDPLGRLARLLDDLRSVATGGRLFARGEQQDTPPDPALVFELREGADRISRELPKLIATLDYHLPIQARRSSGRQGHHPGSGR